MLNGLGCFTFARHYLGNHYCFLFLRLLRCFSSPGFLLTSYVFRCICYDITRSGLPHSETCGSSVVSTFPQNIAGNRVLHRLLVPRHPPYALNNLTKKFIKILFVVLFLLWLDLVTITINYYSSNLSKNLFLSKKNCGANRDRTDNLRLARAALSQLSYSPKRDLIKIRIHTC